MAKAKQSWSRLQYQVKDVQQRYRNKIGEIDLKGEKVITMIMIAIQNRASFYTPQDTNLLINSQYRQVAGKTGNILRGIVGYTAGYAAALHGNDVYKPVWSPRRPDERSPQGGAYNPNATPFFLSKAADESIPDARQILQAEYGNL